MPTPLWLPRSLATAADDEMVEEGDLRALHEAEREQLLAPLAAAGVADLPEIQAEVGRARTPSMRLLEWLEDKQLQEQRTPVPSRAGLEARAAELRRLLASSTSAQMPGRRRPRPYFAYARLDADHLQRLRSALKDLEAGYPDWREDADQEQAVGAGLLEHGTPEDVADFLELARLLPTLAASYGLEEDLATATAELAEQIHRRQVSFERLGRQTEQPLPGEFDLDEATARALLSAYHLLLPSHAQWRTDEAERDALRTALEKHASAGEVETFLNSMTLAAFPYMGWQPTEAAAAAIGRETLYGGPLFRVR
jgi:hypothetical protein